MIFTETKIYFQDGGITFPETSVRIYESKQHRDPEDYNMDVLRKTEL
jgi:hypothetical protein